MVATLTRIFGVHNLELAEDVVQETLLKACRQWAFDGVPENPSAWLFRVAKNHALDVIRREKYRKDYAADISALLKSEYTASSTLNELFLEGEIRDDQLRMMFACCHPAIPPEAQVTLTLKTLCGFSAAEIARAFLTGEDTVNKRLYRAKEKLRETRAGFEIPSGTELTARLDRVLASIYLLFNEGYNSTQHEDHIREDLIGEAIRLATLLSEHPRTAQPEVFALLALMLFHAGRTAGRISSEGEIILLADQDRSTWNAEMINAALRYLGQSASGEKLSLYHIEAGIAYNHAVAENYASTDWAAIVQLYDLLTAMNPSPVVTLNRAVAVSMLHGPAAGLEVMQSLSENAEMKQYQFYYAALGDMKFRLGKMKEAKIDFEKALSLAKSKREISLLERKVLTCVW